MTPDAIGMQLHDRSTRGEILTPAEPDRLEGWYTLQDAQEIYLLQEEEPLFDLSQLRVQVDVALTQLTTISQADCQPLAAPSRNGLTDGT